ncbi:MSCRAMM family protein [Roseimaritima ulvae]|uniref:MSCRAMM family protein n=1 Tax=Roseimaritima ulvae TaxID=980254 RepID=UPI001EE4E14C|nr:SdrD B-like domain-containing protein [Roseimaritima ulvae]
MPLRPMPSSRRRFGRFEPLESRRLLATLGVDIRFLADDAGSPGAELQSAVLREEAFWVEVRVQDIRTDLTDPAGVIALPLNLSWDPNLFQFAGADTTPAAGIDPLPLANELVTDQFPLQRAVASFDADAAAFDPNANAGELLDFFNLRGVRGGALPNSGQGDAIGLNTAETFSRLQFVALANANDAPFTVNLDGSMSFADAAPLDEVAALGNATDVTALANTVAATLPIAGGQISGSKFDDTNGDGVRDTGEPGLADVTIQLTPLDPTGTVQQVTTDADGNYLFADLPAGSYTVAEVVPTGSTITLPTDNQYDVVLEQDSSAADGLDFGNFSTVTLSGLKFEDLDGDGVQDADEAGLAGVTIRLNTNSDDDSSNDRTAVTDANGEYTFSDVGPGTHTLSEVIPANYQPTTPLEGSYVVTVSSGQDRDDLDFGNQPIEAGSTLAGVVYNDVDRDGIFDANEYGLVGWTVELFAGTDTTALQSTTTDAAGNYRFDNLPAGTYRVVETQMPAFVDASITLGSVLPSGQTRGTTNGFNSFEDITLGGQESAIDYNFGEVLAAVTKRMFLSSTNVRQELCANSSLSCQSILGTAGDDEILVEHLTDNRMRVTVNDAAPVELSADAAAVVLVEGLGGQDTVSVIGNQSDEDFTAAPSQVTLTAADQRLGVFGGEQITVDGGGGSDTGVLNDSDGADQLTASGDSLQLTTPDDQRVEMIDIDTIAAISAIDDAEDQADIDAIDFVLRLTGDWT